MVRNCCCILKNYSLKKFKTWKQTSSVCDLYTYIVMRNDKMHGHIKIKLIFVYLSLRKYDYNCNNLFKSWIVMNSSHNMSNGVNACSDATSRGRGAAGGARPGVCLRGTCHVRRLACELAKSRGVSPNVCKWNGSLGSPSVSFIVP